MNSQLLYVWRGLYFGFVFESYFFWVYNSRLTVSFFRFFKDVTFLSPDGMASDEKSVVILFLFFCPSAMSFFLWLLFLCFWCLGSIELFISVGLRFSSDLENFQPLFLETFFGLPPSFHFSGFDVDPQFFSLNYFFLSDFHFWYFNCCLQVTIFFFCNVLSPLSLIQYIFISRIMVLISASSVFVFLIFSISLLVEHTGYSYNKSSAVSFSVNCNICVSSGSVSVD